MPIFARVARQANPHLVAVLDQTAWLTAHPEYLAMNTYGRCTVFEAFMMDGT